MPALCLLLPPQALAGAPQPWWTVADAGPDAYTHGLATLGEGAEREAWLRGRSQFRRAWVVGSTRDGEGRGLGPLYNRLSCIACHPANGRGLAPAGPDERLQSMLLRLSLPGRGAHGGPRPHPAYGDQLQEEGVAGVPGEGRVRLDWRPVAHHSVEGGIEWLRAPLLAIGETAHGALPLQGTQHVRVSARVGSPVFGLGLLADVPEAALQALARQPKADGVRGRLNRVWDPVTRRMAIGRFGWKANVASLQAQVVQAAAGDLGLTSDALPQPQCSRVQTACRAAAAATHSASPELDAGAVQDLTAYLRGLAVPAPRLAGEPRIEHGRALFQQTRCSACHRPTLPQPAGRADIAPYTDLLLHDLGPGLADGRPDFAASGRHWRTPPLWGLGLVERVGEQRQYLHDGRARSLREAVLWHGGEAAASRRRFERLDADDQAALLQFLESL